MLLGDEASLIGYYHSFGINLPIRSISASANYQVAVDAVRPSLEKLTAGFQAPRLQQAAHCLM